MTQPVSVTGKTNVWESFNDWLTTNVPESLGFTYGFGQALDPAVMPRADVTEFKFFDPGDSAMGGDIFPANAGLGPTQGKVQRMMVEINLRTDGGQNDSALEFVRQMRDWFVYALQNAGVPNENLVPIFPGILINDALGNPTNIAARVVTEVDNAFVENFFDPAPPESKIFRYQLLFRLEWYEMR